MTTEQPPVAVFHVGQRVRHAYPHGHGLGTVTDVHEPSLSWPSRWPYTVKWDNGEQYCYATNDLATL